MANPAIAFTPFSEYDDPLLMRMPPVNVLLTGGHGATREVLARLLRDVGGPILAWYPGERLILPRHPRVGTLILHEVGMMTEEDQLRLLDWLETRSRRIQIVSTTSAPLQPQVNAGNFNDTLYFRLNTVRFDL
ncbi:MAG: sigma 54-interacting transcriptional regulator [Vicinamibacterales bacterium]